MCTQARCASHRIIQSGNVVFIELKTMFDSPPQAYPVLLVRHLEKVCDAAMCLVIVGFPQVARKPAQYLASPKYSMYTHAGLLAQVCLQFFKVSPCPEMQKSRAFENLKRP